MTHTENTMRRRKSRLDLGRHAALDESCIRSTRWHRRSNRRARRYRAARGRQRRGRSSRNGGHRLAARVRVVHDRPRSRRGGLRHVDFQVDVRGRSGARRDVRGDGVRSHRCGVLRSAHRSRRRAGLLHHHVRVRDVVAACLYLGSGNGCRIAVVGADRHARGGGTASHRRAAGTSRTPRGLRRSATARAPANHG